MGGLGASGGGGGGNGSLLTATVLTGGGGGGGGGSVPEATTGFCRFRRTLIFLLTLTFLCFLAMAQPGRAFCFLYANGCLETLNTRAKVAGLPLTKLD